MNCSQNFVQGGLCRDCMGPDYWATRPCIRGFDHSSHGLGYNTPDEDFEYSHALNVKILSTTVAPKNNDEALYVDASPMHVV